MRVEEYAKDVARLMAKRGEFKFQHGAVIIRNSRIIAAGWNHRASGKLGNEEIWGVHAEIDAIERTKIRALKDAVMVLYAESRGRPKCSRPCPNCWKILAKLGFKRVIYSSPDSWKKENLR